MSRMRIAAIGLIFCIAWAGWFTLGLTTTRRSLDSSDRLSGAVEHQWGTPLAQYAPIFSVQVPGSDRVRFLIPEKNDLNVTLTADYRKKGLIWYPTYVCAFSGEYTVENAEQVAQKVRIRFNFPSPTGTYDAFSIHTNDKRLLTTVDTARGVDDLLELAPGEKAVFRVNYITRGMRDWRYIIDPNTGRVRDLSLVVESNFRRVDYTAGSLSPMQADPLPGGGMRMTWQAADLITRSAIGVIVPERLNPGPLTARITYFAPVCLLFFFVLVTMIGILRAIPIHPMHYLFVAAGFFAFHLLLAYMVGLVNIHVSFVISATVSVVLVTTYLAAALRGALPWKTAVAAQLFFLVLFSYSFFLEGFTGLTVAVGSVVTLAVLMRLTAHVNWEEVFAARPNTQPPPVPPTPARGESA